MRRTGARGKAVPMAVGVLLTAVVGLHARAAEVDVSRFAYEGMAPDAAWRAAAAERIDTHRKGDLAVEVRDTRGRPVTGAAVAVRMKRHAFAFGTEVQVDLIADADSPDAARYRQEVLRLFTYVTVNPFYLSRWRSKPMADRTLAATLKTIDFFQTHNIPMHGHVLVWKFRRNDTILEGDLDAVANAHIDRILEHPRIAGAFKDWDVLNEPTDNNDIYRKYGNAKARQLTDAYFRRVHRLDPQAHLFVNEAGQISGFGRHKPGEQSRRVDFIVDLVKDLQARGTPVHGIGCQSHHVGSLASIPEVLRRLDRLAALGPDLQITEYDIKLIPASESRDYRKRWRAPAPTSPELEQREGQYMRDFLTACFSHPKVTAFIMWGFWDGKHWLYNAPIFRKDWTLKPQGKAYVDLVLGQWWTNADGATDAAGRFATRGFLGRYEITATHNGQSRTVTADLVRGSAPVGITID